MLVVVSLAILLYLPNLLVSIAKPTIALHKANFGSDKGRLAFLQSKLLILVTLKSLLQLVCKNINE